MEPIKYGEVFARRWKLFAALAVLGLLIGVFVRPSPSTPKWKSKALVEAATAGTSGSANSGAMTVNQLESYAANQSVAAGAATHTGLTTAEVQKSVKVSPRKNTNGLSVIAVQAGPQASANLANSYSDSLVNFATFMSGLQRNAALQDANQRVSSLGQQLQLISFEINNIIRADPALANNPKTNPQLVLLEAQSQALSSSYGAAVQAVQQLSQPPRGASATLAQRATASAATNASKVPALDHTSIRAGVGVLIGLLLAAAISLLLESRDKRIRSITMAKAAFGLPVISEVPLSRSDLRDPQVFVLTDPLSRIAESFRILRMAIVSGRLAMEPPPDRRVVRPSAGPLGPGGLDEASEGGAAGPDRRVILVVSPGSEPTRPVVTANLAAAYAESGEQVLVVTTDSLARPSASSSANASSFATAQPSLAEAGAGDPRAARARSGARPAGDGATVGQATGGDDGGSPLTEDHPAGSHAAEQATPQRFVVQPVGAAWAASRLTAPPVESTVAPPAVDPSHDTIEMERPAGSGNGKATPDDVQSVALPTLAHSVRSLRLGRLLDGPGQLASKGPEILVAAREVADVVIVESSPLLSTHAAEALMPAVDVAVVVGECWHTPADEAARAMELLQRIGAPVAGLVLTRAETKLRAGGGPLRGPRIRRRVEPDESSSAPSPAGP